MAAESYERPRRNENCNRKTVKLKSIASEVGRDKGLIERPGSRGATLGGKLESDWG